MAHPLLNRGSEFVGSGPVVLVVDDGWGAGRGWADREAAMLALIDRADRAGKPVIVLTTAKPSGDDPIAASGVLRAADARRMARAIKPKPWPVDRAAAAKAVENLRLDGSATVVWLSDGLAGTGRDAVALAEALQRVGSLEVYADERGKLSRLVLEPQSQGTDLVVPVLRATTLSAPEFALRAVGDNGKLLAQQTGRFADNAVRAEVKLELPGEIRNEITRVEIEAEASAGATFLIDERWRRRPVGVFSGETAERAQPLLSDLYYVERALNPVSELRRGTVDELLGRTLAVMVLADVGKLTDSQVQKLEEWIERGGVIVRFAGAAARNRRARQADPGAVCVRAGASWAASCRGKGRLRSRPSRRRAPSPGLAIPPDVRIERQVLAEPSIELDQKTWARLTDGTPLVTAEKRGKGFVVLVHTTANAEWSNLPLSGLFVQMLQRLVGLSQGIAGESEAGVLAPIETMNGFGRLESPPSTVAPIEAAKFAETKPAPRTPPGYYGREGARRALNLASSVTEVKPLPELPSGVTSQTYPATGELDLKPWLLLAALLIALFDLAISFFLRGLVPVRVARAGAAMLALLPSCSAAAPKRRTCATTPTTLRCKRRRKRGSPTSRPASPPSTVSAATGCAACRRC